MALRPGLRRLCSSRPTAAADLRAIRDEHVARARERIFGPQGDMPGDRYFRKKLEGSELMRWYFPSKYSLQDFRVDDYFEMQAERNAPRDVHHCIPMLTELLERASVRREELRSFFQQLDEATFMRNPTLQDLYGVFRLVDSDPALAFSPPQSIWQEHSPLYSQAPPFRAFAADDAPKKRKQSASGTTLHGSTSDAAELKALFLLLKSKLGDKASTLEARVTLLRSLDDVREVLLEEAHKFGVVVPFEDVTVIVEEPQQKQRPHGPTFSGSPAETNAGAAGAERTAEANTAGAERTSEATADAEGTVEAKSVDVQGTVEAHASDTEEIAEAKSAGAEGTTETNASNKEDTAEKSGGTETTSEAMPHREDNGTVEWNVGQHLIGSWRYGIRGSFDITYAEGGLHLESRISPKLTVSGVLEPVAHDDLSTSWLQTQLRKPDGQTYGHVRLRHLEESGIVAFQMQPQGAPGWSEEMQAKMEPRPDVEEKLSKDEGNKTFLTGATQTAEAEPQEAAPSTAMTQHETAQSGAVDVPPVQAAISEHGEHSNELARRSEAQEEVSWSRSKPRLVAYAARPRLGGDAAKRNQARLEAEERLGLLRKQGPTRDYLARRHRFVDPMYRRRRLKWLERHMAQQHNEIEVKFNNYYAPHPDDIKEWPTNKGSVTVEWPSPYH